ncbi:MAG: hypothetical protein KAT15_05595, partial [Bacteroidales bacterium]|nr:hypothetical protein [Bacteroidales bacterium]
LMGQDTSLQALYPWDNLGNMDFNGRFTGYPDQFVASGLLATDLGRMFMDLSFSPDSIRGLDFNGRLMTRDFRLGEFLNQERTLSQLDMNILTDGNLYRGQIQAELEGTIDTLEFYQYAYSNITLDGAFTNTTFDGGFSISDPNIRMDFLGKMDFSGDVPEYNFTADVARARPYFLNLGTEDPNSFASFLIETNVTGRNVDLMNGEIRLVNSLFERKDEQVQLYDLSISSLNTADTSRLQIRSDILNANIEGRYQLSTLPASFRDLADRYLNIIPDYEPRIDSVNHFNFQVDVKRVNPLLDFFLPSLQIGDGSQLQGSYHPSGGVCTTVGFFPDLQIAQNRWTNLDLFSEIANGAFLVYSQSDSMTYEGSYSLIDQQLQIRVADDSASMEISWDNRVGPAYNGEIKLTGTFQTDSMENRGFLVAVHPTEIFINDDPWNVDSASILLKRQYVEIDSLSIISEDGHIMADGTISREEDKDFHMEVKNLNLA